MKGVTQAIWRFSTRWKSADATHTGNVHDRTAMSVTVIIACFKNTGDEIEKEAITLERWLSYARTQADWREAHDGDEAYDHYSGTSWKRTDPDPGTVEIGRGKKERYYLYWSRNRIRIPAPHSPDEPIWEEMKKIVREFSAVLYDEEGKVLYSADNRYPEGTYLP